MSTSTADKTRTRSPPDTRQPPQPLRHPSHTSPNTHTSSALLSSLLGAAPEPPGEGRREVPPDASLPKRSPEGDTSPLVLDLPG